MYKKREEMKKKIRLPVIAFLLLIAISPVIGKAEETKSHFGVQAGMPHFSNEMKEAGVEIVREWINWKEIEPTEGRYNWSEMDRRVQAANQVGIEILGFFVYMPDWAKKDAQKVPMKQRADPKPMKKKPGLKPKMSKKAKASDFCEPKDINDFRRFARAIAERYDGRHGHGEIKYIEILNEVTVPDFFEFKNPNNSYEMWLINGYEGVKTGNPEAKVLIGGFVDPLGFKHTSVKPEMDKFINSMLADYNRYFDIVSFHSYSWDAEGLRASAQYIKERMRAHNLNKPMWITETATALPPGENIDLQNRMASDLVKRYAIALGEGVQSIFWYTFIGTPTQGESPYGSGIKMLGLGWDFPKKLKFARTFHPRQAYHTYKLMTSKLKGFKSVEKVSDTQYRFTFADKGPVYVLWRGMESYPLPQGLNGKVLVTDYKGNVETREAHGIVLTENPIFVE